MPVYPPDNGRGPARVVLVDDDAAVRNALSFALETEGYVVVSFPSGEHVLAGDAAGDCYIIDDRLGGMSGVDLVVRLRAKGVVTPAILITTNPAPDLLRRAKALGAPIVEKPLIGSVLANVVERLLTAARP